MPAIRHRVAHFLLDRLGLFSRSYRETAYGREFIVPIINGRKTYVSEPWMADIIEKLLEIASGSFIDVGANLGQTMLKVAAADPLRQYIGFEPNPACSDYCAELIRANSLPFIVIPAGLGSATTVARLNLYREDSTDPSASLIEEFRDNCVNAKTVVTISLEDLPQELVPDDIAVVKIDVEGGEADVIVAIATILRDQRPFVLCEILPAYSAEFEDRIIRQKELENVLANSDYGIFRIHRGQDEIFDRFEAIDEIGVHGDLGLSDYLMVPVERVREIKELEMSLQNSEDPARTHSLA